MSSAVKVFVHAICKHLKKCLVQKVGHLGLLHPIPIIQLPLNITCVALQHETGTKFFHRASAEIHGIKGQKLKCYCVVFLEEFVKYLMVYS